MDWFLLLLAITTIVRGMGAGMIYDVALVSLPVRRKIGALAYTRFARALYSGGGVMTYGAVSILGVLLTIAATINSFAQGQPAMVSWPIASSLFATVLAFIGTSRALPAVRSLQHAGDDPAMLSEILGRFARWHTFSAFWQAVSFIALAAALANYP